VCRRILLGAFGDPGHAFPMIALGRALAARGHDVWLQTWERWRTHVESEGIAFAPAPEYSAFPGRPGELGFYEAAYHGTRDTLPLVRELDPDAVVSDVLTLAPALAGELHGAPVATLIPHIYPAGARGLPIYSIGARLPRTGLGRSFWEAASLPVRRGLEQGRRELNAIRERLGLAALPHAHGGISTELALVATFPQLEYPRAWPAHVHVVGPLLWEPPGGVRVPGTPGAPATARERQAGRGTQTATARGRAGGPAAVGAHDGDDRTPLVLVAPSTSQDPGERLLKAALRGLGGTSVRVLASRNRVAPARAPSADGGRAAGASGRHAGGRGAPATATHDGSGAASRRPRAGSIDAPANATLVDWISYADAMPRCDLVLCHAGHGTLARALSFGRPVLACPVAGDMNENAARVAWAGVGVRLPRRFIAPRPLRLAVEQSLRDGAMRERARALAAWAAQNDAGATAAGLVEQMLERRTKLRGWDSNPHGTP
jgi:UDP:flavonoid glycosyltransferase YjiC (YdhE family)